MRPPQVALSAGPMSSSISRPPSASIEHVVTFGHSLPGAVPVPLRPLAEPAVEVWEAGQGVVFGSIVAPETKPLEELAREVYGKLIADVRQAGHPYFVRMWNYVGGINEYERDRERY